MFATVENAFLKRNQGGLDMWGREGGRKLRGKTEIRK